MSREPSFDSTYSEEVFLTDHHRHDHDHCNHLDHYHRKGLLNKEKYQQNIKFKAREVPETRRARNRTLTINPATSNSSKTITVMTAMMMVMMMMVIVMMVNN